MNHRARTRRGTAVALAVVLPIGLTLSCGSDEQATPTPPVPSSSVVISSTAASSTTTPPPGITTSVTPSSTVTTTTSRPVTKMLSALTGKVEEGGPVLAVKIENTSAGRPQYGLADADVVYVEQVEGGLTRLIGVFHSVLPDEVGPVRSMRTTDVDVLQAYGSPGLVFSGGAGLPLERLAASSVVNLSEDNQAEFFWRSDVASAPYNLHVNLQTLAEKLLTADEDALAAPKSIGFTFAAKPATLAKAPKVTEILVEMLADVQFEYTGGKYHVIHDDEQYQDGQGDPVYADNVLLQNVLNAPDGVTDANGSPSYETFTVGEGTFTLFRDGRALEGNWSRKDANSPTVYLDAAGKPVPLKPGRTWVLLAPQNSTVTVG